MTQPHHPSDAQKHAFAQLGMLKPMLVRSFLQMVQAGVNDLVWIMDSKEGRWVPRPLFVETCLKREPDNELTLLLSRPAQKNPFTPAFWFVYLKDGIICTFSVVASTQPIASA